MTDTKKPETLRLAMVLDGISTRSRYADLMLDQASAELRRLHAENAALQQGYDSATTTKAAPQPPAPQEGGREEALRCAAWMEHIAAGGEVVEIEGLARMCAAELRRLNAENATFKELRLRNANDAARYRWLRSRDLDTIKAGGVFAGKTPDNVVLNGEDLDAAIDAARLEALQ